MPSASPWGHPRYYERGEDRYINLVWPQAGEIYDLDRVENRRVGVVFNKSRPLTREAIE